MESDGCDGAILRYDVDTDLYDKLDDVEEIVLHQRDRTDWRNLGGAAQKDMVKNVIDMALRRKFVLSQVVSGPIVANADEIDREPIATEVFATHGGLSFP
tara:strand:+ start:124 stop:423 length:300 start_codon:yes stop_codon:yes gene_type:complete